MSQILLLAVLVIVVVSYVTAYNFVIVKVVLSIL